MKTFHFKKSLALSGVTLFSLFILSCGDSGSGGPSHPSNPGPGVYPPNQVNNNVGFYSQTSNFVINGYQNRGSEFIAQQGMKGILGEAMGICDREHISGGLAACETWLNGAFDLVLFSEQGAQANNVKIIFRAVPGQQLGGHGWYSYSLPKFKDLFLTALTGWSTSNPSAIYYHLNLSSSIWPINNSQGFEVRANGPNQSFAQYKLFQLHVAQGKLEDMGWNYKLFYNGQEAASGTAIRCESANCGLDSSYYRY